jgi:hypothetical protein
MSRFFLADPSIRWSLIVKIIKGIKNEEGRS